MVNKPINLVPEGSRLTFIKQTVFAIGNYRRRKNGEKSIRAKGLYICACGLQKELVIDMVQRGVTKSCGCLSRELAAKRKRTHGLAHHPLNGIWNHIKGRCYTETDYKYPYYGAIGVRMCDEWRYDFRAFYDWCISNGWESGLQIDKDIKAREFNIIPGLLYSPEWCSIVTGKQNANSKRNNRFIEYKGQIKTVAQWSEIVGIDQFRIISRLDRLKWSIEDALEVPVKSRRPKGAEPKTYLYFNGKSKNISDWSKETGLKKSTIRFRLKSGWSIEKTLTTSSENTGKKK